MLELYSSLSPLIGLHFIIISVFALILQSMNYTILIRRDRRKLFEVLIGIHLLIISVLLRDISSNIINSTIILPSNVYILARYIIGVGIIFLGIYNLLKGDNHLTITGIILISITLPVMENLPYGIYTLFFISSIILLSFRAGLLYYSYIKRRRTEITGNSIKEAFDTQYNGILFAEKSGRILLENKRMVKLVKEIMGENSRNASNFWAIIERKGRTQRIENRSWRFHRNEIDFRDKKILQITAIDISEQENIIHKLEDYGQQLKDQQIELKKALDNLEELGKEEAISRSWEYIHGSLGQKISFLQRMLKNDGDFSLDEIRYIVNELQEDLINIKEESWEEVYEGIVSSFKSLGVNFHKKGGLPSDKEIAKLFVEVIREGSNNAIRHGDANNIYLELSNGRDYRLMMRNDGKKSPEKVIWGGGLNTINKRVKDLGGIFKVTTRPDFLMEIEIQK